MKNSLVAYLLTSIATFGFAPDHLDGLKIKFDWGEEETSIVEFTEFAAYEMDDETGTNREFAGDYDAVTERDTVIVTLFGHNGANDVFTLNFTTEATGNGLLQDFEYLQPSEADGSYEPTNQANIYKDLIGSGEFRFDVINPSDGARTENPVDRNDTGSAFGLAPSHLDGFKIKFDWGEDETSIVEFTEFAAYEMDDESGTNREFAGDYDAVTERDTVIVTLFGHNGANDVFTLNFTTEATGNGLLQDFEYLQPSEADGSYEPTNQANIYKDLIGSGEFSFDVINPSDGARTENPVDRNDTGSAFGLAPLHLDGFKIKFDWGEDETSIVEFTEFAAYEMDDESGTNREFAGDYDADTERDTVIVTLFRHNGCK
jgi:hypothetical protein